MIVSGGDPLVASPRRLAGADGRRSAAIDHVKVVRFHTRVPVVAPERVTADLVAALKSAGKATWVAIHANHPRELTPDARARHSRAWPMPASRWSARRCCSRGVNDDPDDPRRADARLRRVPGEALLPPPRRPRARHRPFPHHASPTGQALMRGAPRAIFGPLPADLCPRYSRRPRQVAGRPGVSRRRHGRGLAGRTPRLSRRPDGNVNGAGRDGMQRPAILRRPLRKSCVTPPESRPR